MRITRVLPMTALLLAACDRPNFHVGGGSHERSVAPGKSVTGALAARDHKLRGRGPYQLWALQGKRGQRLVIEMTSSRFDSYVVLRSSDGYAIGADDDGGGSLNARLRTILPRNDAYTIVAGSVTDSSHGDYTLTVSDWVMPDAPRAGSAQALEVGQTKDGLLEPGDEITADGPYQDRWTVDMPAGARRRVEMHSTDVDSYLILLGPNDSVVATNDDAMGRDAAIVFRAPARGRYTALATTFGDQPRVGAYRIALSEVTGAYQDPGQVTAVSPGETKDGQLEPGDSAAPGGGYRDFYLLRPAQSGVVTIDMTATGLDSYLVLQDSTGTELLRDDDGGGNLNARLVYSVQRNVPYRIVATSFGSGGRSGSYRLAVAPIQPAPRGKGRGPAVGPLPRAGKGIR